jgi:tetratricopeptide (TPR) repeat protein
MKNVLLLIFTVLFFQISSSQTNDSSSFYYQKGLAEKDSRLYMVAFNDLQKSTAFKADNIDAQRALGLTSLELKKYDNAELAFQKVEEIKKDDAVAIENLANLYFWTNQRRREKSATA